MTQEETTADTEHVNAEQVTSVFGLGTPRSGLVEAARGWGGLDVAYRFETKRGSWAIKGMRREFDASMRERFAIESAALTPASRCPNRSPHQTAHLPSRWTGELASGQSRRLPG